MIYITGDTHGDVNRIRNFCNSNNTTENDIIIILGDAGFNFYLNKKDDKLKYSASKLPITIFCIRGNHEERPENVLGYKSLMFRGGNAYYQPEYSNIIFAKDGEIYDFEGKSCLVIGGAYSVDKFYRITYGLPWFPQEQLSLGEMEDIKNNLCTDNTIVDYVLTHTCPYNTRPTHLFLPQIDQSTVDNSMEYFLQDIADKIKYDRWYFGHYHDNWESGKYTMLYRDIIKLGESI